MDAMNGMGRRTVHSKSIEENPGILGVGEISSLPERAFFASAVANVVAWDLLV